MNDEIIAKSEAYQKRWASATATLDTEPCPACHPREGLRDTTALERVVRRLVDTIVRTQVRLRGRNADPVWLRIRDELRGGER